MCDFDWFSKIQSHMLLKPLYCMTISSIMLIDIFTLSEFLNQAHTCLLEITFVHECVCVCLVYVKCIHVQNSYALCR